MLIVCAQSGTVLYAGNCYILEDSEATDEFFDTERFSDAEVAEYARTFGRKLT